MSQSDENIVRRDFWPKLSRSMAHLPFANHLVAAWYCAFDPATPLKVKGTLLAALVYFVMPIDVIPDVLLGLGFTDDLAVLLTAFRVVRPHVTKAHRDQARLKLDQLKNQSP